MIRLDLLPVDIAVALKMRAGELLTGHGMRTLHYRGASIDVPIIVPKTGFPSGISQWDPVGNGYESGVVKAAGKLLSYKVIEEKHFQGNRWFVSVSTIVDGFPTIADWIDAQGKVHERPGEAGYFNSRADAIKVARIHYDSVSETATVFPPFIPIQDPIKLWHYITDNWAQGKTGLPDVFEVEKMGFSRDAYIGAFQAKWETWNQNLRGAIREKDLEKATRIYFTLYSVYSAALSYGPMGTYKLPQDEYESFVKSMSKDRKWYGAELQGIGIRLHPDTLPSILKAYLQEDTHRRETRPHRPWPEGVSFYAIVQAQWWGMAADSWHDVWANVFMMDRPVGSSAPLGMYAGVQLYIDGSLRVVRAPHGIQSTVPHIQERYNDGDNGVYIDGYAGYKLPVQRFVEVDLIVTPLVTAYQDDQAIATELVKRDYRQVRAGSPSEGKRTYRMYKEKPERLMWISPDDELGIRVVNTERDLRLDAKGKPAYVHFGQYLPEESVDSPKEYPISYAITEVERMFGGGYSTKSIIDGATEITRELGGKLHRASSKKWSADIPYLKASEFRKRFVEAFPRLFDYHGDISQRHFTLEDIYAATGWQGKEVMPKKSGSGFLTMILIPPGEG